MADRDDHFALGAASHQMELPFPAQPHPGVSFLRHGARRYAARHGLEYSAEGLRDMQADPTFQHRVARSFERTTVHPQDHRVKKAYAALAHEVGLQYDYLTKPRHQGGLGVEVSYHAEDPYKSHQDMQHDIHKNRRLKVFASASTGGAPHDLMDEDTNDKFRAVHDAFGHAATGRGFTRHGEEAAYHSHMQMFTDVARPAMATETRLQNSVLNYGSKPGTFPAQKAIIAPAWATKNRVQGPRIG